MLLSVATNQPMPLLFKTVTGTAGGGFGLLFLIFGVLFFAGVGSLTAASRCTYAFARDGAIPFSRMYPLFHSEILIEVGAKSTNVTISR